MLRFPLPPLPELPPTPMLLAWVTQGRHALVVGGGGVSTRRAGALLAAQARVTVVSPDLSEDLEKRERAGELRVVRRCFEAGDLDGADLVLVAIDDHDASRQISVLCRQRRIPVHVADEPELCDFYFAAVAQQGPVRIAVSTGGAGPVLAGRIRTLLVAALPAEVAQATERFGRLRRAVRQASPGRLAERARMRWLTQYGRATSWHDLAHLSAERIEQLAVAAHADIDSPS
jgi:precorrin-2 dehydrogenase / sirohydrochlorin ferrochelatase